jgi:3-hydroxymyristoyl/3-hydroxydecanoyl-(acyl carrier protein) dehydratase
MPSSSSSKRAVDFTPASDARSGRESPSAAGDDASSTLPEVLGLARETSDKLRLQLRVPVDLLYLRGHFPEAAILPSVTQIDWAIHFAVQLMDVRGSFRGMDRLKFRRVLLPLDEPELTLELDREKGILEFAYSTAWGRHSQGQLWIR